MTLRKETQNENLNRFLTCADNTEAEKIANELLRKWLIACVKMTPATSAFHWQGSVDNASEVLLIIDTAETMFTEIEA